MRRISVDNIAKLCLSLLRFGKPFFAVEILIPVQLTSDESTAIEYFRYNERNNASLESSIAAFCDYFNIRRAFCSILAQQAWDQYHKNLDNRLFSPASGLRRSNEAAVALAINDLLSREHSQDEERRLNDAYEIIWQEFEASRTRSESLGRFVFLHSCTLSEGNTNILKEILETIHSSGLIDDIDRVWIVNHGVSVNLTDPSFGFEVSHKVFLLNFSSDTSRFEIPTMRLMQRFSSDIVALQQRGHFQHVVGAGQILYLHTKGVSYNIDPQSITDWRRLMTYFLVKKQKNCFHLLQSAQFDTLGVNYLARPRSWYGNFFWATASYLASLPPLTQEHGKAIAEHWVLSSTKVRLFILHQSNVNHYLDPYPESVYASPADKSDNAGSPGELDHEPLIVRVDNLIHSRYRKNLYCTAMEIEIESNS